MHHVANPPMRRCGLQVTRGLGCGGNPDLGRQAATESQEALRKMVQVRGEDGSQIWGHSFVLAQKLCSPKNDRGGATQS